MRIKEFSIMRYGPLPAIAQVVLGRFNLFFGRNEDGKTLTIDALVKLLLGKKAGKKDFKDIDRVDEFPEGYVVIEDEKGREVKLPERGNLTQTSAVTAPECRNIFVIRDSDLRIPDEREFYTDLTGRLTGMRTQELSSIMKEVQALGRLTKADPRASLSDREEFGKVKSRVEAATELIAEIDNLQDEAEREGLEGKEEESARCREELDNVGHRLNDLECAGRRERYEAGREALSELRNALEELETLNAYNDEDGQLWRVSQRDRENYLRDRDEVTAEIEKAEGEFREISRAVDEQEREFQILDERKRKLDEQRTELEGYKSKRERLALREGRVAFFALLGAVSIVPLGVSLAGIFFGLHLLLFYILSAVFGAFTVGGALLKFWFVWNKSRLKGMFERIRLAVSTFGLDAGNIEGILSNVQGFYEEHLKKSRILEKARIDAGRLRGRLEESRGRRLPEIGRRLKKANGDIDDIKERSAELTPHGYVEKLALKRKCGRLAEKWEGVLGGLFGVDGDLLGGNLSCWERQVEGLASYRDRAKDVKYEERAVPELQREKKALEERLAGLGDSLADFQRKLGQIERAANEILHAETSFLPCETVVDLRAIRERLGTFVDGVEANTDCCLAVLEVFEEISSEEREKVSGLFAPGGLASRHFSKITEGFYKEVFFNQEEEKILARRKDGSVLEAWRLSGGAYDQLYLSIRLALGERLLKDKRGFFIMDDPFIKADIERLHKLVDTLKEVVDLGWQIIYFSAKREIKDILWGDIRKGTVNYIEIKS